MAVGVVGNHISEARLTIDSCATGTQQCFHSPGHGENRIHFPTKPLLEFLW